MKALTVQQPWAWAIVHGGKDVENRTQAWGYRGLLAIHAGQRVSERGVTAVPSIMAAEPEPSRPPRTGLILYASHWSNWGTWELATDLEVDAASDRDEVERMAARWEPAS